MSSAPVKADASRKLNTFATIFPRLHCSSRAQMTDPQDPLRTSVRPAREVVKSASRAFLSLHHWQGRMVLWSAAAAVGAAAVGFAWLADAAQAIFRRLYSEFAAWPWIVTPVGFIVIAWLTRRFFPGAEGSGIPQTIFAVQPDSGARGDRLLDPRVVVGRVLLAVAALFSGASIGREGPTVHVGAAIARLFSRWMPHSTLAAQQRALTLAGGAAGVAAAFNTPLAGIVFAIEELSRSFEERASGVALTAVILAGVLAIAVTGDYTYFGQPVVATEVNTLSIEVLAVALAGGLAGGLFSRTTLVCVGRVRTAMTNAGWTRFLLFAALCGILVAAVGFFSGGLTYGTGYAEARSILEGQVHLPWYYATARAIATLAAYLSGIPAGLLAPSLSVGAGLGQAVADLGNQPTAVPFAILGMCGYLAGVTQAPLTSLVIVMEMTTQHAMVLPLMVTSAIATAISKLLSPPLYRTLAESRYGKPI
jgi:H+/Cl- antiporter ClcA